MIYADHKVVLYRASDAIEAHLIKGLLEGEGIAVELRGEMLAGAIGELPPTDTGVALFVDKMQQVRASSIVDQHLISKKREMPDWFCRHCGEKNSGQFEICWQCQKDPNEP